MESNFRDNLSVSDYSFKLKITAHHLNTLVKTVTGKTSTEIIRDRIVLEAKQLLRFSGLNISQISYELGFEDNSYFARYF